MSMNYIALVHKAHKKGADYGVIFPDFPGCVFGGRALDKAIENAREGVIFHIEGLLASGGILPKPTSLEAIEKGPEYKVALPVLIHIIVPTGHVKRVNVCMDEALIAAIDRFAKASGKNRSEFLAQAARQMIA